jgi:hypothetical protein
MLKNAGLLSVIAGLIHAIHLLSVLAVLRGSSVVRPRRYASTESYVDSLMCIL